MKNNVQPNPFECAQRIAGVHVSLKPQDLTDSSPQLTIEGAIQLLDQHGGFIAARMLAAGISAAMQIIEREGGGS